MKYGMRKPSWKKSLSARTKGRATRAVKKALIPGYGKKGMGWLHPKLGGPSTLASYGVEKAADRPVARVHAEALDAVPQAHLDYLNGLPVLHRLGETAFVHAGIRPGIALDQQTETDLIWIREPFLSEPASFGPLIVHGHTAIDHATQYGNRLNLDSGAAYGGPLSAVVIEGREAALLTPTGRKKLTRAPA